MALSININALIYAREVESERIEYKTGWNPESCIHTLCAFANDIDNQNGGYIILGVEETNGRPSAIVGLEPDSLDRIQKEIFRYCHFIEPFYMPQIEICQVEGKTVMVLVAPAGDSRPFSASRNVYKDQKEKVYYVRKGSNTIIAEGDLLRQLFDNSAKLPFDDRINPFAEITDIDPFLMREHLKLVESELYGLSENMSPSDIAESMGLLGGPSEMRKPKNVALLMFSRRTQHFFPYACIEVVEKPDPSGINMVERTFRGPIQNQLFDAIQHISGSIICEKITKPEGKMTSVRRWNYPIRAVREILANAVYHRDYQIQEPVTVTCTPNYIEVRSFPGFDASITDKMIENMKIVSSGYYRNRRIGNFMKELHLTEGRNTGIPMALRALAENGSGKPVFMTDAARTSLTVRIPVHPDFVKQDIWYVSEKQSSYRTRGELRSDILNALKTGSMSARAIARTLGYSGVSLTLTKTLEDLVNEGIITVSGNGRGTQYSV